LHTMSGGPDTLVLGARRTGGTGPGWVKKASLPTPAGGRAAPAEPGEGVCGKPKAACDDGTCARCADHPATARPGKLASLHDTRSPIGFHAVWPQPRDTLGGLTLACALSVGAEAGTALAGAVRESFPLARPAAPGATLPCALACARAGGLPLPRPGTRTGGVRACAGDAAACRPLSRSRREREAAVVRLAARVSQS
jgi:hypothetical protein